MQNAFSLDINKCTGCQACQVACSIENQLEPGHSWRRIETFNPQHHPDIPFFHLSLACNHCSDAPCMSNCPALAYSKDPVTGAVTVHEQLCIGCKYCTWACPYDAPMFSPAKGVVEKCTFCNDRLHDGLAPACVTQCPTGALQLTDMSGATGVAVTTGFPQTDAGPAIRFTPLREGQAVADSTLTAEDVAPRGGGQPTSKISLRSEWPLVVFTLMTTLLVALMSSPGTRALLNPLVLLVAGAVGAGFSTLHLGKKLRAHRAVLNWRGSWLSREILAYSAFITVSTLHLLTPRLATTGAWAPILIGFCTLFAIDRVYEVTRTPGLRKHSAQTVLTGMLGLGLATGLWPLALVVGVLKGALYAARKVRFAGGGLNVRPWIGVARLGVGIVVPALWWWQVGGVHTAVIAAVALGELIDRCEFYEELDVPSPRREMAEELRRARLRAALG